MKILVTGSNGFIAKNLIETLKCLSGVEILSFSKSDNLEKLDLYTKHCDFVCHLAGVNRPLNEKDYLEGNKGFTEELLNLLKKNRNSCPILMSSSIQASLENAYGVSKKAAEELLLKHKEDMKSNVYIYRFPNVFGKWCKPNYNSVIATFCYNVANNMPIKVNNRLQEINLVYIDDVVNEIVKNIMNSSDNDDNIDVFPKIEDIYNRSLGDIADLIYSFKNSRETKNIPNMEDLFTKKLYSTYLSYLPENDFSYPLKMNIDERGSFTEFIRTPDRGQVSVNVSKAGIVKGNHWHHTKNEKFMVVSGTGVIRFRHINSKETFEYYVNGEDLKVVDIPVGYTHNIENIGDSDLVTVMWCNECFDPDRPDTYYLKV